MSTKSSISPDVLLDQLFESVIQNMTTVFVNDNEVVEDIKFISRCASNRAGARLLMSCILAKIVDPGVDPRKPYTEIGTDDSFSGRTYDEKYLTHFINKYKMPLNQTTAFLTPTLRNINEPLTIEKDLVGRPKELYVRTLKLLHYVAEGTVGAKELFLETLRQLLLYKAENDSRLNQLINSLKSTEGSLPLSSEAVLTLLQQHIACRNASRLPVLIVAAVYNTIQECLGESIKPLLSHNAADKQTNSLGDIEICIENDDHVVTAYEMKMKRVSINDIDGAVEKITRSEYRLDNYLFVTTEDITNDVLDYAASFYSLLGGTEIGILDCIGFLKSFLHLFHRSRMDYLDNYQNLVLSEPDSAVPQSLKEAFLALRVAAESE